MWNAFYCSSNAMKNEMTEETEETHDIRVQQSIHNSMNILCDFCIVSVRTPLSPVTHLMFFARHIRWAMRACECTINIEINKRNRRTRSRRYLYTFHDEI